MQSSSKISVEQYSCLLFLFLIGTTIIDMSEFRVAGRDAWLSSVLASIMGFLIVLLLMRMSRKYPDLGLGGYLDLVLGNILGRVAAILYMLFVLYRCSMVLNSMVSFIIVSALPGGNRSLIALTTMLLILYAMAAGIKTVGITSRILFFIYIFLSTGLLLLQTRELRPGNILPVLGEGFNPVLGAAWIPASLTFLEAMILASVSPLVKNLYQGRKKVYTLYWLGAVFIILSRTMTVMIFDAQLIKRMTFPFFESIRLIKLGHFFERMEVLLLAVWVVTSYMEVYLHFFCAATLLNHVFKVNVKSHLLVPLAIVILALEKSTYQSTAEALTYMTYYWPLFSLPFQLLVPLMILAASIFHRKEKRNRNDPSNKNGHGKEGLKNGSD